MLRTSKRPVLPCLAHSSRNGDSPVSRCLGEYLSLPRRISGDWERTKLPLPWSVITMPASASSRTASRAVFLAVSYSAARSRSDGSLAPGGSSPDSILLLIASAIVLLGSMRSSVFSLFTGVCPWCCVARASPLRWARWPSPPSARRRVLARGWHAVGGGG